MIFLVTDGSSAAGLRQAADNLIDGVRAEQSRHFQGFDGVYPTQRFFHLGVFWAARAQSGSSGPIPKRKKRRPWSAQPRQCRCCSWLTR